MANQAMKKSEKPEPEVVKWASKPQSDVLKELETNPATGLSSDQVEQRLRVYGENALAEERKEGFFGVFKEEIVEPMIILLLVVGVLYSFLGSLMDAATIFVIIAVLVLVEVYNEYKAKSSIEALKQLAAPSTMAIRDGSIREIAASKIVPGDLLPLRVGQRIPADARLLRSFGLQVDESTITGEAFPVVKNDDAVLASNTPVAELVNSVLAGTLVTQGEGLAAVVATGRATEIGRVTELARTPKFQRTPLQLAMRELAGVLVWIAVFFSILIPVLGYLRGQNDLGNLILTGLSLAFVTIPEELPIITTMSLAVGAYALSGKHAIVKRLKAAETLGSVTVIATDKTGTITENSMRVSHLYSNGELKQESEDGHGLLEASLLGIGAVRSLSYEGTAAINPMEVALRDAARKAGIELGALERSYALSSELSFDSHLKLASYIYAHSQNHLIFTSGAPEAVLGRCTRFLAHGVEGSLTSAEKDKVASEVVALAGLGERTLAVAHRSLSGGDSSRDSLESGLCLDGVVSFVDPPRDGVSEVVASCQAGGIRVVMLTGDHPITAESVAQKVGIDGQRKILSGVDLTSLTDEELQKSLSSTSVFARISPEDKFRIVKLLKESGNVVAVTGDGVNDAPAMHEADIGIALGLRGTDVAKEAADVVLADDDFATIGLAVREGRKIFDNIRKGVRYYLAVKVALVGIFLLPIILGLPFPFPPIQIILLELFMDLAASSGFVAEKEEADLMQRKPRNPKERFLTRGMLTSIFVSAFGLFASVSACYLLTYSWTGNIFHAQTVAFAAWILTHIFLAFNLRSERQPLLRLGVFSNRVMVLWALAAIALLVAGTTIPALQNVLRMSSLTVVDVGLVLILSAVATFWLELPKWVNLRVNPLNT